MTNCIIVDIDGTLANMPSYDDEEGNVFLKFILDNKE